MTDQSFRPGPSIGAGAAPAFVHRVVVCFEDTNVVGNVYFARHVAWQGACREMFLRRHAPGLLDEIADDLRLVTLRVSCEYLGELHAFDEVEIAMRLAFVRGHRVGLSFDYAAIEASGQRQVAHGFQEIGCMRQRGSELTPCPVPDELAQALMAYRSPSTPVQFACRSSQQVG